LLKTTATDKYMYRAVTQHHTWSGIGWDETLLIRQQLSLTWESTCSEREGFLFTTLLWLSLSKICCYNIIFTIISLQVHFQGTRRNYQSKIHNSRWL